MGCSSSGFVESAQLVGVSALEGWLAEHCSSRLFLCTTRSDEVVLRAAASRGVPLDHLRIGGERPTTPLATSTRVRTRSVSKTRACAELGGLHEDFLLLDDAQALRLAYDDHDRLVVGFVEPEDAVNRYRLIRDVLWVAAGQADRHFLRSSSTS
ncbi:DUF6879 family protein [Pseudonocardia halophobica]|nr:DUF6879 family protein [Pseudonocardia halophobica]